MTTTVRVTASLLLFMVVVGCTSSSTLPANAKLVNTIQASDEMYFSEMKYPQHGRMYIVDDATGRVRSVQTVSPERPNYHFDYELGRKYSTYFVEDSSPTTSQSKAAG